MALTTAEEAYIKKQYQIDALEVEKKTVENTAITAMKTKRDEITALQAKLVSDVKVIDDAIKALK